MDLQEKHSFSGRRISCSFAKAVSREKLGQGEILYELYHRFSLCDGNLSPYDSTQLLIMEIDFCPVDQMAWVRADNQHRAIAEEIILKELIYI